MADLSREDETMREAEGEKTDRTCGGEMTADTVSRAELLSSGEVAGDSEGGRTSAPWAESSAESWNGWKGAI